MLTLTLILELCHLRERPPPAVFNSFEHLSASPKCILLLHFDFLTSSQTWKWSVGTLEIGTLRMTIPVACSDVGHIIHIWSHFSRRVLLLARCQQTPICGQTPPPAPSSLGPRVPPTCPLDRSWRKLTSVMTLRTYTTLKKLLLRKLTSLGLLWLLMQKLPMVLSKMVQVFLMYSKQIKLETEKGLQKFYQCVDYVGKSLYASQQWRDIL